MLDVTDFIIWGDGWFGIFQIWEVIFLLGFVLLLFHSVYSLVSQWEGPIYRSNFLLHEKLLLNSQLVGLVLSTSKATILVVIARVDDNYPWLSISLDVIQNLNWYFYLSCIYVIISTEDYFLFSVSCAAGNIPDSMTPFFEWCVFPYNDCLDSWVYILVFCFELLS